MLHYTFNTGHVRMSPRSEVRDDITTTLQPLVRDGEHDMPLEGYQIKVTSYGSGLLATVSSGDRPCVTFGVAVDDESSNELWPALELQYQKITTLPCIRSADFAAQKRPATTPWCAAIVILATPEEGYWLGDFERCLAWTWIENQ